MSVKPPKRPPSVPASWICARCVGCSRPTWFDPAYLHAAHARGLTFTVVCSAQCTALAVRALAKSARKGE